MNACLSLLLAAAVSLFWAPRAQGFAHAQIGSVIENVELTSLDGAKLSLLSNTTANVFVFFKPGQENSRTTMIHLAACEKEFVGKPVRWVAVVSDRYPKAAVEASVKEIGIAMPILIDAGDALYGKLGVMLCPVLGITDQDHKLVAYEYFTKVNFTEVVRARLRFLFKEIDEAELNRTLNPTSSSQGADAEKARRRLKLAEKLYLAKSYNKALENINDSLEKDKSDAAAYVLKGQILIAQGNKDGARAAFAEALKLEPANDSAKQGLNACDK
jgi:tetratricopeptide (TPR) repeat protein